MKYIQVLFVIAYLCSCISPKEKIKQDTLDEHEWFYILGQAFLFSEIQGDVYLYHEYNNSELKDVICDFCHELSGSYNYVVNDSLSYFIKNRVNKPLLSELDTISLLNIGFIIDTIGFNSDFITISTPFYVDKNKLCFSLANKKTNKTKEHWVYLFQKEGNEFKLISVYNFQNDKLYQKQ